MSKSRIELLLKLVGYCLSLSIERSTEMHFMHLYAKTNCGFRSKRRLFFFSFFLISRLNNKICDVEEIRTFNNGIFMVLRNWI